ncbi:hypothetical protein ACVWZZ_006030 [Bradyrhizobium sp. LM6.10]
MGKQSGPSRTGAALAMSINARLPVLTACQWRSSPLDLAAFLSLLLHFRHLVEALATSRS